LKPEARRSLGTLAAALAWASLASAQTNERIYERLDFRFVTPGARAVGMGKAFVGLADDATAAYSNPAGLSNLLAKEFSFEVQATDIRHERLTSLVPGGPTETRRFGERVWGPSFLSFAVPLDRWTASFFLNTVQNYRESFAFEGRPVPGLGAPEDGAFGEVSVQNQEYGLGLSFVVNRFVSIGASGVVTALSLASEGRSGTPFNPRNGTNTIDSGTRLTGMGGILIKPARGLSIGASFSAGATFDLETKLFGRFLYGDSVDSLEDRVRNGDAAPISYVVPPRLGIGASWRIWDRFTVVFDANRILYAKQVNDEFLIVDFQAQAFNLSGNNFFVRDVWEVHAGAEYRIYKPRLTVAFRGGVFTDPDHSLRFRGSPAETIASELLEFRFNSVSDRTDVGGTVGLGIMLANRFQVDAAASFAKDAREVVVSFVVRP
jgi:long-subunit fatty acid transport protein